MSYRNPIRIPSGLILNITNDIKSEVSKCIDKNGNLTQIFLPDELKNLYDTDPGRLKELKDKSIAEVKKHFENNPS